MKIFKLDANSNNATNFMYKWQEEAFVRDRDFLLLFSIANKSLIEHLPDATCEKIIDATSNNEANFSRFMGVSVNFILDQKAKDVLENNLNDALEFIPIKCEDKTLYLMYVMENAPYDYNNIVRENTIVMVNPKTGEKQNMLVPSRVKKFAFKEKDVENKDIFRPILDAAYKSEIFVSQRFRQIVQDNNLSGFKFTKI